MLLTIGSKVLSKIILLRMNDSLEERLREEQAGFRMKCSCCDHITSRIIVDQTLESNTGLYMVFVAFKKAFDSLEDLVLLWVPSKIIKIIQVLYEGFQARVMHDGTMTEPFEMKTGVRQG